MTEARAIGSIARGLVLSAIATCPCDVTRERRIQAAIAAGLLREDEAADYRRRAA